jgi:hypothetical protein
MPQTRASLEIEVTWDLSLDELISGAIVRFGAVAYSGL